MQKINFRWAMINLLVILILWGCGAGPAQDVVENEPEEISPTESTSVDATEQTQAEGQSASDPTITPEPTATPAPTATVAPTEEVAEPAAEDQAEAESEVNMAELANVIAVQTGGSPGNYNFSVEISSPDEGCQKYADWWEVLTEEGQLLYRRVLLHSHVNEQPFTRSGGPVDIDADQTVWVRAHMNPGGYGGAAFKGSPQSGFEQADLSSDFAAGAANQPPLPDGCAF